jgi:hypothetical protein
MLQLPSIHLTKLARSGHTESLNTLLSYFMQNIGITARSSIKNSSIELILEGHTSTPNQEQSEKYLHSFFGYLQIPTIQEVKIFAKNYNTNCLAWWGKLEFCSPGYTPSASVHNSIESCESQERCAQVQSIPLTNALVAGQLKLPQPLRFEALPSDLQTNFRRVGLRQGDKIRLPSEGEQIYEMVPESIRREGVDAIRAYKREHDWSHKKAYAKGGSNRPSNGDWESRSINRSRGSRQMTKADLEDINKAKAQINFQEGARVVHSQATKAGAIAFGVEVAFSGLENFLAVQRGEKTVEQALGDTLLSSAGAAVVAVAVVGSVSALTLVFPPVGVALGAATPFLQIVGVAGSISRLVTILSNTGKVQGIDQLEALMLSYGIDDVELDFRDLEVEDELLNLKLAM